ncbi:hypothetical protein [Burkholderia gladioli]|uniref:hypothetical protein n=1 Tax=Burkholderia gladioli TaxID=28095 RepID=UPI00264FA735|nr:hypothetical protein [Burkholderia gladioli]MDN7753380.1 hypothetical protein [Burkholderia gladioli]
MSARDMVWRRLLVSSLAVAAALGIAACGKGSGGDQAAASDQRFPGYQQVGGSGDAAQLWFNPTDITRDSGAYLIHALKSFPDGYARFDVATNCRDLTRRMPGRSIAPTAPPTRTTRATTRPCRPNPSRAWPS